MNQLAFFLVGFVWTATAAPLGSQEPPELKVFTTRAIATVLDSVGPGFERSTGYRLDVTTDIAIRMVRRIRDGEPFDVLVAAPEQIAGLIGEGRIVPETRTHLARSGAAKELIDLLTGPTAVPVIRSQGMEPGV